MNKISSFFDIPIEESTLVICDIDETVLYTPLYKGKLSEYTPSLHDIPHPTDIEGFQHLVANLREKNGELIFLTARGNLTDDITRNDLRTVGIDENPHKIFYTNNWMSKGKYIFSELQNEYPINKWNRIIFIDDKEREVKSVYDYFPQIHGYVFVMENT